MFKKIILRNKTYFYYTSVAILGCISDIVLFYILVNLLLISSLISFIVSYIVGVGLSYIGHLKFSFVINHRKDILYKYIIQMILMFLFNFLFFVVLLKLLSSAILCKIIQLGVSFVINFYLSKLITFK